MPSPESSAAPGERLLWAGRPALRTWWPVLVLGLLLALAALPLYVRGAGSKALFGPLLGGLALAAVWLKARGRGYQVTSQRVRSASGLLAVERSEVELGDIRNLKLRQRLGQRLLGIGDVEIESSGGPGVEILISSVAAPGQVLETIRRARLELQQPARPPAPSEAL